MYKELVATEPNNPIFREYDDEDVKANEIKIEVKFGAPKHGTELTIYRGESPFEDKYYDEDWNAFLTKKTKDERSMFPWGLGNMWVGEVIEKGVDVNNISVGQRVAGFGHLRNTHNIKAKDALILPSNMTWKEAVCYDPAHFALAGLRDSKFKAGDRVAIFGMGAIGLLTAQLAKRAGARWVAIADPIAKRRNVALNNGADIALDPSKDDVGLEIKKLTDKMGVDVSIESSGSSAALHQAIRSTAYNGKIAVVGWYKRAKKSLHFGEEAHHNIPDLIFSRACSQPDREHPRWDFERIKETCWWMLSEGWLNCEEIVDPVVEFRDARDAYIEYVDKHPEKSIKLGVKF